jgi:type IX secretion system PorP/SprF family membrane protein
MLTSSAIGKAQKDVQYTQYFMNTGVFNPGVAGATENLVFTGLYRSQWTGWGEGAPISQTVHVAAPVNFLKGGVSLHILNDAVGLDTRTGVYLSYGYKITIGNGVLSPAIGIGFLQSGVDAGKLKANSGGDAIIPTGEANSLNTDFNIGAFYKDDALYLGASITHINSAKLKYFASAAPISSIRVPITGHFIAGYNFPLTATVDFNPSVLIKIDRFFNSIVPEANGNFVFNDKFFAGASYRHLDAAAGVVGYAVNDRFKLSYSYDFTVTKINTVSNGSHEIVLRYEIPVFSKLKSDVIIKSPRFL